MDASASLLQELTDANGVSGYEGDVRAIMLRHLRPLADSISVDKLGSVMAQKKGSVPSPRVMVVAHMDEIGFMVKEITADGYIKFLPLGGWWGHVALGQRMRVITSKGIVIGVVGSQPPHLLEAKERERVREIKEMFIDVGVHDSFDARKQLGIRVGDPIVPDSQFTIMGSTGMYLAKGLDNRMACAVVVDVMKQFKRAAHPNTLLGCATVQEEIGTRGAQTLSHLAEPDVCIVVDTGIAQDMPPGSFKTTERIGAGPAILIYDAGMIPNIKLRDLAIKAAEQRKIPFHLSYMERGATDGQKIHQSRSGVPTIALGAPVRYIHSHNSMMHRTDYDHTVKLVSELVRRLDAKTVRSLTD